MTRGPSRPAGKPADSIVSIQMTPSPQGGLMMVGSF